MELNVTHYIDRDLLILELRAEVAQLRKHLKQETDAANVVIPGLNKEIARLRDDLYTEEGLKENADKNLSHTEFELDRYKAMLAHSERRRERFRAALEHIASDKAQCPGCTLVDVSLAEHFTHEAILALEADKA